MLVAIAVIAGIGLLGASPVSAAVPINDSFENALELEGESDEHTGYSFGATKQAGEPNHAGDQGGASVWFFWTAPRSENALLQLCTSSWTGFAAVYKGTGVDSLQALASTSSQPGEYCRETRFKTTAATTYHIAIDGHSEGGASEAEQGEYILEIDAYSNQALENDAFATPTILGSKLYFGGSSEGATREPGEPNRPGGLAGASVWYRWTAPATGWTVIFPCRANFHPLISVYTGSELATLTAVGAPAPPAHPAGLCQLGGQHGVGFDAVAGTAYSVSIDSGRGEWGEFQIQIQQVIAYADRMAPATFIRKRIRRRWRRVKIGFFANEGGATFLCKRDKRPYRPCSSPQVYRGLATGRHRFMVKAVDPAGNVDPSPAIRHFRIKGGKGSAKSRRKARHRRKKR